MVFYSLQSAHLCYLTKISKVSVKKPEFTRVQLREEVNILLSGFFGLAD